MCSSEDYEVSPNTPHLRREAIPAFTYLRAWAEQKVEIQAAVLRAIDSGCLILGREVAAFEHEFARFVGVGSSISVSSGTDALIVAMRALGIGIGAEVITVPNGPVPTVAAIRAVGAVPKFVDVDEQNLQMCPNSLESAIGPQTRCVIPIHLYGYPAPMDAIAEIASRYHVPVIEDCAQAHGTFVGTKHAGTLGAIGCFSFYPTKNLGAFGDGGMCVTNDPELAAKIREQARYGFRGDRIAHSEGLNCRLDELQAAILRVRLRYLERDLSRRQAIAANYLRELKHPDLTLPAAAENGSHAWHLFVVRSTNRRSWMDWLGSRAIQTNIHYEHPVHLMPAYQWLKYTVGSMPHSEKACSEVFSLPMFPELADDEVSAIVDAVRSK